MRSTIPRIAFIIIMVPVMFGFVPQALSATKLKVPLYFDSGLVRDPLLQQVFNESGEKCSILDEDNGCRRFILDQPFVDVEKRRLKITARGSAHLGETRAGACRDPLDWKGFVEILAEPVLDPGTSALALKIVDFTLLDESHKRGVPNLRLNKLVKTLVYQRFEALRVDFSVQMTELRALLPSLLPDSPEDAKTLIESLTVKRLEMAPEGNGVLIVVSIPTVAEKPTLAQRLAKIRERQQQRRLERLEHWDAFLTFVIKSMARKDTGPFREKMLDALFDARHAIAEVQFSVEAGQRTPLPILFMRTWKQVRSVALEMKAGNKSGQELQGVTSFVATTDAALSLSEEGENNGLELSDDSLRIMARKLDPQATEDPVKYSTAIDPELRTLLGFGDPLPAPSIPPDIDSDIRAQDEPPADLLAWLSVGEAWADTDVVAKLRSWAPEKKDLDTYLPLVRQLLENLTTETLAKKKLDPQYHTLYRDMVFATAWQESCWRQFIRKNNKLTTISSAGGSSVGLMQVNHKVWRGIYDPAGLFGDIAYNGRAGCEILLHYLRDYAIAKKEHLEPGGADNLARASYAIYNGGPGQRARYRKTDTKPALKKIDELWWGKYTAVREGKIMDVANCYK